MAIKLNVLGANQTELSINEGVVDNTNRRIFFSYSTPVAAWILSVGYIRTEKHYSNTTSKHIASWLAGNVAKIVPQSEIDNLLA